MQETFLLRLLPQLRSVTGVTARPRMISRRGLGDNRGVYPLLTALHLGALHAHEKALVALIAFGPFVVLFAVVFLQRRRDERD